jgi:hypothetical protein
VELSKRALKKRRENRICKCGARLGLGGGVVAKLWALL